MGGGKVVRDLPYFLYGALDPQTAVESEEALLKLYHTALTEKHSLNYPFETFVADYHAAFLDYYRHVVSYMWATQGLTPDKCAQEYNKFSRLVHNKSALVVERMTELAADRFAAFEAQQKQQ